MEWFFYNGVAWRSKSKNGDWWIISMDNEGLFCVKEPRTEQLGYKATSLQQAKAYCESQELIIEHVCSNFKYFDSYHVKCTQCGKIYLLDCKVQDYVEAIRPVDFARARKIMIETFKDQSLGSLYYSYTANISCCLQDKHILKPLLANKMAEDIMKLLFKE